MIDRTIRRWWSHAEKACRSMTFDEMVGVQDVVEADGHELSAEISSRVVGTISWHLAEVDARRRPARNEVRQRPMLQA
jgi:hypothetical protein